MSDVADLLSATARAAAAYLEGIDERPVGATVEPAELAGRIPSDFPEAPLADMAVLDELLHISRDAVLATGSPRFFGFVIGGALPAAIAADWLTSTWDQNAGLYVAGPAAAALEAAAGRWILDALDLPRDSSFAIVTGCQMAHLTCLAAARHQVFADVGWDVERDGLIGAPRVRFLVGAGVHVTVARAARVLGFGDACIETVAASDMGEMDPVALERALDSEPGPAIVCAQLGEINTGAMDPVADLVEIAHDHGAWLHVDGAFGLWARASAALAPLVPGVEGADSWATDGHKMLNVPYDCGIAICAHPTAHLAAISVHADYLMHSHDERRDGVDWTPDFSRRARGIALFAALRSLGRQGLEELIDRCCANARRMGAGLQKVDGAEVLNRIAYNQVLVGFSDDARTAAVIEHLQRGGECWVAGTHWHDRDAMRISITGYRTTAADVDRTVEAIRDALAATA
ncbi:MAG: pyridoxal phosphate-dependent decarboxylase family protein [Microthrixaceae bacterium]